MQINITTKYEIYDEVYFYCIEKDKVAKAGVSSIEILQWEKESMIKYHLVGDESSPASMHGYQEDNISKDRDEVINIVVSNYKNKLTTTN